MCFINSNSNQLSLLMDSSQHFPEQRFSKELRRDVQKPCIRMSTFEVVLDASTLSYGRTARYRLRRNTHSSCSIDLICLQSCQSGLADWKHEPAHHQRQQWRDDDRDWKRASVARTWYSEKFCVLPLETAAGSWKHNVFPNDVAACRNTSWPSMVAVIISRWSGLTG
jgi:hypothetical protein